jgi:dihydroxyacetone kinase phosphotransfer subunit
MVNLVIVSHSRRLAEGVCEVARQMADEQMQIVPVGGIGEATDSDDTVWTLGTNGMEIAHAIEGAMTQDGVLVLVDLGSACFAAEEALQMLSPQMQAQTVISNAPLVEGAIVAAVEASLGASLHAVNTAAEEACRTPKR